MKITAKGQVTIPQPIRKSLGWKPHTKVDVRVQGDQVVLARTVERAASRRSFRAWLKRAEGSATSGLTTDEIMRMTRGED